MGSIIGTGRSGTRALALGIITVVALAACTGDDDDSADDGSADTIAAAEFAEEASDASGGDDVVEAGEDSLGAGDDNLATGGSSAPSAPLGVDLSGRDLAVEAGVVFATPDVRRAVDEALVAIRTNGGIVFSADVRLDDEQVADDGTVTVPGSGTIVVKVVPQQLDSLIEALDGEIGELLNRTQSSEDVTTQLVDLELRIEVERTSIDQFQALLGAATEIDDIVRIQDLINERTIRLEQLLASERALEERVDQSTLTIDIVYEPLAVDEAVVAEPTTDDGLRDALAAGWNAFAAAFFTIAFVLAVLAPFLVVAVILGGVVWAALIARSRRRAGTQAHATNDQPAEQPTG
ncbi:MAG: DUF4349 domain-containing protein [Actinomycetota bacterium]